MKEISVRRLEGMKLEAVVNGHTLCTDLPPEKGGEGSEPSPTDLLLAAVATCSNYFALMYFAAREMDAEGLSIGIEYETDEKTNEITKITTLITVPEGFPEKQRAPLERAIHACHVKKHLKESIELDAAFVN